MKKLIACVVVILSLPFLVTVSGAEKRALDINGTWKGIVILANGKQAKFPEGYYVLVFKDGKYSETVMGKETEAGTYKMDAAKNPPTIDFAVTVGTNRGKTQLGILNFNGDVLTIALSKHGSTDRPKNLKGADESAVTILRRSK
jgi:uncharacterized protein (TIGR03067 family)